VFPQRYTGIGNLCPVIHPTKSRNQTIANQPSAWAVLLHKIFTEEKQLDVEDWNLVVAGVGLVALLLYNNVETGSSKSKNLAGRRR
jgi:hypothetical protein